MNAATSRPRSWPVLLLALPAFVAIWSGWVGLGSLTGFGTVHPLPGTPWDGFTLDTAITLPIGVETYAAYALHVWLSRTAGDRAERFARLSALGSLGLGAAGQVTYHLMIAAGMVKAPWPITALVACLPVAVLGMGAALAHLVAETPPVQAPTVEPSLSAELDASVPPAHDTSAAPVPAPGYQVHPDARVEPVPAAVDDVDDVDPDGTEIGEVPAPRPAPRLAPPVAGRPAGRPTGSSTAVTVTRLRAKHPQWTVGQIAEKAGCSIRTARRHLNPPAAGPQVGSDDAAAA
jgi:hypothetical protein